MAHFVVELRVGAGTIAITEVLQSGNEMGEDFDSNLRLGIPRQIFRLFQTESGICAHILADVFVRVGGEEFQKREIRIMVPPAVLPAQAVGNFDSYLWV